MRNRCAWEGCLRYAQPGTDRCSKHAGAVDRGGRIPTKFEQDLDAGVFHFGADHDLIRQLANEPGVDNEIGIMRHVMDQLLEQATDDPVRTATALAKIASATVQAQRARRVIDNTAANSIEDALSTLLEELAP